MVEITGPRTDPDTYGLLLRELFEGREAHEVMERSDGLIYVGDGSDYFHEPEQWPAAERAAVERARGRVLDIGCCAGRIALYLQQRGHEVVAIDESANCVFVSQTRGVLDTRAISWQDLGSDLGTFDTIALVRNNFGLMGDAAAIPQVLRGLSRLARPGTLLISDSVAPSRGGAADDQWSYRVRHQDLATPWFKYLMFEPENLASLLVGTDWEIDAVIDDGLARWNFVLRYATSD